jgi:hypothetical protein
VRAISGATTSNDSDEISLTTLGPIIWNGTVWSNGTGPTSADDAIISGDYTSSGDLSANNLTVTVDGSFIVSSGDTLTLAGVLTNNATNEDVVIASDAYFVQNNAGANTGAITVKRDVSIKRLDIVLWSSPVATQNLLAFSPETLTNRFFNYSETANNWVVVANPGSQIMNTAQGYGIRAPNDWATSLTTFSGSFVGIPNNGSFTQDFTSDHVSANYNLVGNPYPSALNLRAFYNENSTKILNSFYFFEHTLSSPAPSGQTNFGSLTIAPNAADNEYIPASSSIHVAASTTIESAESAAVGQGFFVRAIAGESGTLSFDNSMRGNATGTTFFRANQAMSEATTSSKYRLRITNPDSYSNFSVIGYYDYASDAEDVMDTQGIGSPLYSLYGNKKLVVQGFDANFNQGQVVQLGYQAGAAGTHTIDLYSAAGIFANNQYVILHDATTGSYHNLSLDPYQFQSETGTFDDRFTIVYTEVLSVENPFGNNNILVTFESESKITVKSHGNAVIASVEVYDLAGRLLYKSENLSVATHIIEKLDKAENILLVRATTVEGVKSDTKLFF